MKSNVYKEVLENTTDRTWQIVTDTPETIQLTAGCYTIKIKLSNPQYNHLNFELVDRASRQQFIKKGVKQTSSHYTSEFQDFVEENI